MPSVFVAVPQFPSVPALPGVPQLVRALGALTAPLPANISTVVQAPNMPLSLSLAAKTAPVWGIFDVDGAPVISPDSIMDFNYRSEFRISDYPVQAGQFSDYNKVAVPFEIPIRMVKGSTLDDRTQFIQECEIVVASLDLYTVITPERTYVSVNPTRFEYSRRETSGAFFIEAEMYFRQIQQVTPQYSSTTSAAANTSNATLPGAQPQTSLGLVQPQIVGTGLAQTITDITTGALPSI
jgi:hypothetical protein